MADDLEIDGRMIEISKTEKVFYAQTGYTKGDVIDYYHRISQVLLPHLKDRPLSLQRFPDGINGGGFYQKERPDYFPDWIDSVQIDVKDDSSQQKQVVCNDTASLVYLADQAVITPHRWLSRMGHIDQPDLLIFDLDPPQGDFELVCFAARKLKTALEEVELAPYLMTTGSQGLHVVCPLIPEVHFDASREFAHHIARKLADQYPDRMTVETRKDQRHGRLFLDYLRNAYGQTAVAPYALRPIEGAPIATPLSWDELNNGDLTSQSYNLANIFRRLGHKQDPWRDMQNSAGSLHNARHRLSEKA